MILKHKASGKFVEIVDIDDLTSPYTTDLVGCLPWQEELPDPKCFAKSELCFPSGEELPGCWQDNLLYDEDLMEHLHSNQLSDSELDRYLLK